MSAKRYKVRVLGNGEVWLYEGEQIAYTGVMAIEKCEQALNTYTDHAAEVSSLEHDRIIREAYEAEFGKLDELRERIAKTTDSKHLDQLVRNRARDYASAEVSRLEDRVVELEKALELRKGLIDAVAETNDILRAQLEAAVCKCCDRPLTDDELKDAAGLSGEALAAPAPSTKEDK